MGQGQDRPTVRRGHARIGAPRQAVHRLLAALVAATLISGAVPQTTAPGSAFDERRAWRDLNAQCDFGPRPPETAAHTLCKDWIVAQLRKSCDTVAEQPFEHLWSQTGKTVKMTNVYGDRNWRDAKIRVLLVAHWDTRPTADMEPDPEDRKKPILGANDGASGVAVLTELARTLRLPKDVGVRFLMVDGEDLGPGLDEMFLGADFYARKTEGEKGDYGILVDMVGDKDLRIPREPLSAGFAPELQRELYLHAKKVGLEATFPMEWQGEIYDDHLALSKGGVPTIDLIDFTYPAWHTLRDKPDQCSPASLGKVGRLLQTWLEKTPPFVNDGK